MMRNWIILLIAGLGLTLSGCTQGTEPSARESSDSPARKAGKAAHELAVETEAAAKKAGKKISEAAKEAREGWKEAEREDHTKGK